MRLRPNVEEALVLRFVNLFSNDCRISVHTHLYMKATAAALDSS